MNLFIVVISKIINRVFVKIVKLSILVFVIVCFKMDIILKFCLRLIEK